MALDKKQIALTVGGILAGLTLTYLLYRLEQSHAATNAANAANASAEAESQLANQQAEYASLPSINVPQLSSTPSPTDTTQQATSPAASSSLEQLLASLLAADVTGTTSQNSPSSTITNPVTALGIANNNPTALTPPTSPVSFTPTIAPQAPVASQGPTASPIKVVLHSSLASGNGSF